MYVVEDVEGVIPPIPEDRGLKNWVPDLGVWQPERSDDWFDGWYVDEDDCWWAAGFEEREGSIWDEFFDVLDLECSLLMHSSFIFSLSSLFWMSGFIDLPTLLSIGLLSLANYSPTLSMKAVSKFIFAKAER